MRYRDNMTPPELKQLLAELTALDPAYGKADEADEANRQLHPTPPEYYDEMEELRRAALDSRGRP